MILLLLSNPAASPPTIRYNVSCQPVSSTSLCWRFTAVYSSVDVARACARADEVRAASLPRTSPFPGSACSARALPAARHFSVYQPTPRAPRHHLSRTSAGGCAYDISVVSFRSHSQGRFSLDAVFSFYKMWTPRQKMRVVSSHRGRVQSERPFIAAVRPAKFLLGSDFFTFVASAPPREAARKIKAEMPVALFRILHAKRMHVFVLSLQPPPP